MLLEVYIRERNSRKIMKVVEWKERAMLLCSSLFIGKKTSTTTSQKDVLRPPPPAIQPNAKLFSGTVTERIARLLRVRVAHSHFLKMLLGRRTEIHSIPIFHICNFILPVPWRKARTLFQGPWTMSGPRYSSPTMTENFARHGLLSSCVEDDCCGRLWESYQQVSQVRALIL